MSSRPTRGRVAAAVGLVLLAAAGVGGWQATRYAAHAAAQDRPRLHTAPELRPRAVTMPAAIPAVVNAVTSPDPAVRAAAIAPDTLQSLGTQASQPFYPAGTSLRADPSTWRQYGNAVATMTATAVSKGGSVTQQLVFLNSDNGWLLSMTAVAP